MFELYAVWAAVPTLVARMGHRPASRRAIFWLAVLVVAVVCTLQDPATNKDREVYTFLISAIEDDDVLSMEPGFYLLVRLLGLALSGPALNAAFFFIVAAASMAIKLQLFRRYGGSMFGCLAAFFSYFFLVHEITQVRTGLAIGVLYLSWFAFAEGRRKDFWWYGIAASMFHVSCVLFVIAPLLLSLDDKRRWALNVAVVSALAAASALAGTAMLGAIDAVASILGVEKLSLYVELLQEGVLSDITPVRLGPYALLLAAAALTWKHWKHDRLTLFVVQTQLYGLLFFVLLAPIPAFAYRVSDLFLFAGVFVMGRLRRYVPRDLYYPLVVAYTGMFLIYTIQFSGLFIPGEAP